MQSDLLIEHATRALEDLKATDIQLLDVRDKTQITDYLLIASGRSSRQVAALAEHLALTLKQQGVEVLGIEGQQSGDWVLVDLGDLVVHIMQPETRGFYELEKLWGDYRALEQQV